MAKIFIDGSAGTTGLRIVERLSQRKDLTLVQIPDELRKDPQARKEALAQADITFLCLPDDAARETAALAEGTSTVIIDTSTAHRTAPDWTYGFPELTGQREKIAASKRIANPGCHASGFIALVAPLVEKGVISPDALLSAYSLTGYSGGGKKMIAQYEDPQRDLLLQAPGQYGLTQKHKHLPEMVKICALNHAPVFCPVVAPYYSGMQVTVPLFTSEINAKPEEIKALYQEYYQKGLVSYSEEILTGNFLYAGALSGRDDLKIAVCGNEERILLTATFDNLGKGASGAAIQNMNLVLGLPEETGLNI